MTLNRQAFKTRTVTAIVFAAVMLLGLLWNQWSFLLLFSVIHFGCWWEYLKLTEKIYKQTFHIYTKFGLMVMGYGWMLWFCGPMYHINSYGLKENLSLPVSAAGFALLLMGIFQKNDVHIRSFVMALGGLVYISLSWGLMMDLYSDGKTVDIHIHDTMFVVALSVIPLLIVVSIWINDTMAYLVGSLIGKTPLSPVSPKKTWEGTIGGILLAVLVVGFLFIPLYAGKSYTPILKSVLGTSVFFIAALATVSGTLGDLFESKLKRMAGVKDSGQIMPGHGGFLDRFDSMLLATPAVWLYVYFFMH
jgi:phosphatidate cytidylyltransferase